MTILIGKRFDNGRIIIGSDTMISDPTTRAEIVPGRLKVLALSNRLSIAYAGNYIRGIDSIREVERNLTRWQSLSEILDCLIERSIGGQTEFIVASHFAGPELRKVSNGTVTANQRQVWAGRPEAVAMLAMHESKARRTAEEHREEFERFHLDFDSEAYAFESGFFSMLLTSPILLEGVGGLPIILDATAGDHSYQNRAGAYAPGSIKITAAGAQEELADGGNRYGFQILGLDSNLPFAAASIQETGMGYVYAPLVEDRPVAIPASDVIQRLRRMSNSWAAETDRRRVGLE